MQASSAGTPDLADHLDRQVRTQERELVVVRLAVVALAMGFLITVGEPADNRVALMGVLAGIAAYSLLIGLLLLTRLPSRPVAVLGVTLDAVAVTAIVSLATNVPDAYLFYGVVILGVAVRFGIIASVAASVAIGATYLVVVYSNPSLDAIVGQLVAVRVLFLVIFGVVAGLFSRIIIGGAAENARLQRRLEAEEQERERGRERELLSRLSRDFGASLERQATLRAIVAGSAPLLGDATLLLTLEPGELQLTPAGAEGRDRALAARWLALAEDRRPTVGRGIVGLAAATSTPRLGRAANIKYDPDVRELGLDWILAIPVHAGDRLQGVLATGGAGAAADDRMRRMAESLADRAGPALQNAQLWADLQERVAREQQAQRVKDDFLSVVSHELRTPLTSIQGYSQLLEARLRDDRTSSKELAQVTVILSQVLRMRRLVDDLLDVSRIDRRWGVTIEPVDFDFGGLLRDAVGRIARAEPRREISLAAPDSLLVHLDRQRMDQVLSNLLENAVKYSPQGGPIGVSVEAHRQGFEVRVSDTGIGVRPDQREHVFESFYQADDGKGRRRFGGLGLGLAITRAIVEAHGGTIWVDANEEAGRGSIFAMRLPRTATHVEQARPPDEREKPPRFRRRSTNR